MALTNAALLRAHRFEEADIENIAEEIDAVGKSAGLSLSSHLTNLASHLLKWQLQPERRSCNWKLTIGTSRVEVERILRTSPSLKPGLAECVANVYPDAVKLASIESGLQKSSFPSHCPYSLEQLIDDEYLP